MEVIKMNWKFIQFYHYVLVRYMVEVGSGLQVNNQNYDIFYTSYSTDSWLTTPLWLEHEQTF